MITRDAEGVKERVRRELEERKKKLAASAAAAAGGNGGEVQPDTDAIVCGGLDEAMKELEGTYAERLGKVFVIGGAEIYGAALGIKGTVVRIVMTNVEKLGYRERGEVFECDTFFPVDEELLEEKKGWRKASAEEVTEWVGEPVTGEWREEGEVRIQMVGYERVE